MSTYRTKLAVVESLLREWDPLGVLSPGDPDAAPADEYDAYAPRVYSLLARRVTVDELAVFLSDLERKEMGSTPDYSRNRSFAMQLLQYWAREAGGLPED